MISSKKRIKKLPTAYRLPLSFSHLDHSGAVRMVDVSAKKITERFAKASAVIRLSNFTLLALRSNLLKKGDALTTAKIAGILAAKKVSELIPLTHPIPMTHCEIRFENSRVSPRHPSRESARFKIISTVKTKSETGVEMEALTAVSIAALTLYDMVKSVERGAAIEHIQLEEKSGGKSGHFKRSNQ